ncbi:MAG: serine/threonine-protein kinase, partial [Acidobacteriota bacterium]
MSGERIDYGTAVPLSSGGAGEVYKAYDAKLGRHVALKFLRSDDPAQVRRLAREARTQANLPTHPNLCAIYGVGDYEGRPYMAMEHIAGEALDAVAQTLSVAQRVRAIAQIAEALSIVHAAGLVHRDIKPANIVLARDGDGDGGEDADHGLRPVLVDFGTVWSADLRTLTRLGQFVGTPAYMAPEQVRGGHDALGPAADIYALGATLFHLLTGRLPFAADQPIEALRQVLDDEAPRLRAVRPDLAADVSIDLERVVLRCLAKDPADRYGSTAALAADLRRCLRREPIAAGRPRWNTHLMRRLRRLKLPLRALAALLALAALALGLIAHRWHVRRDAVQRYDALAQSLEGVLRAEYMSAPHDVRPARQRVRARLDALQTTLADAPGPARGPLQGAIGRGALALDDGAMAAHHLRAAWNAGHRTPTIAYALGRALGLRYAAALDRARQMLQPAARAAAAADAARRYRDPARAFLERGRSAPSTAPAYVEATLLFYEGRYDAALDAARRARDVLPWRHEADELIGTIQRERAAQAFLEGDDHTAWRADRAAGVAYRTAMRSAGSDPRVALGACRQRVAALGNGVGRAGASFETSAPALVAYRDAARVACRRARLLRPDDPQIFDQLAQIQRHWAVYQLWVLDEDPRATVNRGRALCGRAIDRAPRDPLLRQTCGQLAVIRAQALQVRMPAVDPRPGLDEAQL